MLLIGLLISVSQNPFCVLCVRLYIYNIYSSNQLPFVAPKSQTKRFGSFGCIPVGEVFIFMHTDIIL